MAHFAQINEFNQVSRVVVIANEDCGGGHFPESEPIGQAFLASIGLDGTWLQTSYSGSFRNLFAGVGCLYNALTDEFEIISSDS
jgi:hypothetical protein